VTQTFEPDRVSPDQAPGYVPGPRGSLLLGLALHLQRDQLRTYETLMAEYGQVVRIPLGPPGLRRIVYLVTHPDGVERVLAVNRDGYTKDTPFYEEIAAYLGDGLVTSSGSRWQQQRRTVAPLFSARRVAGYVDVMAAEATRLADRWTAAVDRRTPVDLDADMDEFALRAVGRVLFGADVDDAIPVIRETFPILNQHARRRGLALVRLPHGWPTPAERRAMRAKRALYRVVDAIIDRRRGAADGGDDLVSRLLVARDPQTGKPLSAEEIRDQLLILLIAGHETSSTALTCTFHLLGQHPDAQRRVHCEVDDVLAGRPVTADDIGKLSYTTMVIKEALRLYPPAYVLGRVAPAGDTIAGHRLPPGSIVLVSPWATHRHPEFWEQPHRFDPERFTPSAVSERPRYAYFPFAGGVRGCLGEQFAMAEIVTATASLIARYTFESQSAAVSLDTDITLRPAGPVHCLITARFVPDPPGEPHM
jgi:cytochrome P450